MADEKDWTIMVYMSGDNNLSIDMSYAMKDIREVAKGLNEKVNVMVFYDSCVLNAPTLYCDFTDFDNPLYMPSNNIEKRFKHRNERLDNHENDNAATMYSLMNFVDWCVNPEKRGKKAKRHALIVSGHGFGFQAISFLKDNRSNYYMTIRKFRASLEKIRDEVIGRPLDLIGFDCCVMSMLEIGYEIRNCAATMVASEGSIPNAGWTYGSILGNLICDSSNDKTEEVARGFVQNFIETQQEFAVGGVSVDMSAWDMSKVEDVVAAADKLGEILLLGLLKESDLNQPLKGALIQAHWESQSYMFEQNVDLKDFTTQLLTATQNLKSEVTVTLTEIKTEKEYNFLEILWERCGLVIDAVDNCILQSGFSGGTYQFSNGISIFFPWTLQTYLFSEPNYQVLKFSQDKGKNWNAFLLFFLREATLRGYNSDVGEKNLMIYTPEKIIANPANKIIVDPANKIIANAANKIIANPANKIIANAANKIIANPANKIIENPANKIIANPANKIIENTANRAIEDSPNRIEANIANKILDGTGLTVIDFKNTAKPWDIVGFTKNKKEPYKKPETENA